MVIELEIWAEIAGKEFAFVSFFSFHISFHCEENMMGGELMDRLLLLIVTCTLLFFSFLVAQLMFSYAIYSVDIYTPYMRLIQKEFTVLKHQLGGYDAI